MISIIQHTFLSKNKFMNKPVFFLVNIFLISLFYILDRSFLGIFGFANFISISIIYIISVLNFGNFNYKIFDLFYFGILLNWSSKSFFGILPLLFIIIAFLFDLVKEKFAGNIISLTLANFVISFLLFSCYHEFIFDIKIIIGSIINSLIILFIDFLKNK